MHPIFFFWYQLSRNLLVIDIAIKTKIILTNTFEIQAENNRIVKDLYKVIYSMSLAAYIFNLSVCISSQSSIRETETVG